jgi:hypothetical protein
VANEVGKLALALSADIAGLTSAMSSAARSVGGFKGAAAADLAAVGGALKSAESGFVSLGGIVKTALAGAAVAGIGAFAVSAVKAASDVSESQNKVNAVFGDGAKAINDFANGSAQKLGISRAAALDAAGSYGNLFLQLGIGSGKAGEMSKGMLTLAADLGSFHNADITEVIEAQTAAFRGEFDSVQKFVPTINAAAVAQAAMAMTGKSVESALTDQDKALAVHKLLTEGAGKATGDFAATNTGMANSMKIIKASFSDITTEIGDQLLPMITPLISTFAQALPGAFEKFRAVLGPVGETIRALASGEGFDRLYAGFTKAFGPETAGFLASIVDPIAKVRTAITALASGDISKAWELLSEGAKGAAEGIQSGLERALSWLGDMVPTLIAKLSEWGTAFVEFIGPKIPPMLAEMQRLGFQLLEWMASQVGPLLTKLAEWGSKFISFVAPLIPPMLEELGKMATRMLTWIAEAAPPILTKLLGEWVPAMIGWVAVAAVDLLKQLPEIVKVVWNWVTGEGGTALKNAAVNIGSAIISGAISGIKAMGGALVGAIWDLLPDWARNGIEMVSGGGGGKYRAQSVRTNMLGPSAGLVLGAGGVIPSGNKGALGPSAGLLQKGWQAQHDADLKLHAEMMKEAAAISLAASQEAARSWSANFAAAQQAANATVAILNASSAAGASRVNSLWSSLSPEGQQAVALRGGPGAVFGGGPAMGSQAWIERENARQAQYGYAGPGATTAEQSRANLAAGGYGGLNVTVQMAVDGAQLGTASTTPLMRQSSSLRRVQG